MEAKESTCPMLTMVLFNMLPNTCCANYVGQYFQYLQIIFCLISNHFTTSIFSLSEVKMLPLTSMKNGHPQVFRLL